MRARVCVCVCVYALTLPLRFSMPPAGADSSHLGFPCFLGGNQECVCPNTAWAFSPPGPVAFPVLLRSVFPLQGTPKPQLWVPGSLSPQSEELSLRLSCKDLQK